MKTVVRIASPATLPGTPSPIPITGVRHGGCGPGLSGGGASYHHRRRARSTTTMPEHLVGGFTFIGTAYLFLGGVRSGEIRHTRRELSDFSARARFHG